MNTLKFGNGEWYGKKDTILAYNDENSNFKPLPFSFDRASSATVNKDGLIETVGSGEPRIDYKDDSKGALKLEPSRSNLITYSNEFTNSSVWGAVNTTFTDNETQSPSGLLTGKLTRNVTTFSCIRDTTVSTVLGTTYVFSAFYKKDTETTINHGVLNETTGYVTFNFDTETISITRNDNSNTISTDGFGFEKYANGWYRVYLKFVRKAGSLQLQVARQDSGVIGQSTFIYGAQLEANSSYATSYIPTSGGAVTRVADVCNNGANEQVINSTEGVLYYEGSALADDGTDRRITLSDNSLNNAINFGYSRFSGNINSEVISGGVLQTSGFGATGVTQENNNKFALSWGGGTFKFYINGVQKQTAPVTSPIGMNNLRFSAGNGSLIMFSNTKDLRVYNTALTDQELINLTTI